MNQKIAIIGSGISGMTAGIYLQQAGFQTEIFEKNTVPGGECTGWIRNGYTIDNCIHWLTGTKNGSALNHLWKNTGVLGNPDGLGETKLIHPDKFYSVSSGTKKITFWHDLERTREELLAFFPADTSEINQLIDYTKLAQNMNVPVEKPFDLMNLFEYLKLGHSMRGIGKIMHEYGSEDIADLSRRFQDPLLQSAITAYMPASHPASAFLFSYATISGDNGDIPEGGSKAMALRMVKRYTSLGGILHLQAEVAKIMLSEDQKAATGICLRDGTQIQASYIVCACDPDYLFQKLLSPQYMPDSLKALYQNRVSYPVISGFQVAFALDAASSENSGTNVCDCRPLSLATEIISHINYRSYDYEPDFAPEGKTVLQTNIMQTEDDYAYWEKLNESPAEYNNIKRQLAKELLIRLEEAVPAFQNRLTVLDVWTPVTYQRFCNAYHGSYMSFITTKKAKSRQIPGVLKKLPNVMLASQWLMGSGGLPSAAATGRFAAYRICKQEHLPV